jgi:hypothetical protein
LLPFGWRLVQQRLWSLHRAASILPLCMVHVQQGRVLTTRTASWSANRRYVGCCNRACNTGNATVVVSECVYL